jgi:hypothetical protein
MKTPRLALITGLLLATTLGACSAGAAPSPTPAASTTPQPSPTAAPPTQVPGGIGSDGPNTGIGGGGGVNPDPGQANFVVPRPGTRDPHPVSIQSLQAQVDGRRVIVIATWTSGVEPCYQLDTAAVKRDANSFTVALTEGHGGAEDVACIEIAMEKSTRIDLGELEPGDYTVSAQDSPAEPITFTIT